MDIEILILKYLSQGMTQAEIADKFKENKIHPDSLSSIEKRLKDIRAKYRAKTIFQLGYIIGKKNIV